MSVPENLCNKTVHRPGPRTAGSLLVAWRAASECSAWQNALLNPETLLQTLNHDLINRYLAPEACSGRGLLPAIDVWAAGVMVR